jgi:cytochrome c biogenesis protein CcmG/thiol:disulfide interchange protein DsbE
MADTSSSGSRTGLIIGVVGGLVVLLLVAAVMFGSEEVGAEYGEPEISGTALTLFPNTESIDFTAAGQIAPDVLGKDYDGSVVTITNDGTAKAIVFLAHWCSHCQAEVPRVQEWLNETGGVEGVDMYSVSTAINSGQPNYPGSTWLENENWTVPVVVDNQDSSVLTAYGSGGFPYWVFLNADGTVAVRTAGELSIAQLEEILNTLEQ